MYDLVAQVADPKHANGKSCKIRGFVVSLIMLVDTAVMELRSYIYTKFVFASVVPGHTDLDAFAKLKPLLFRQDKILACTVTAVALTTSVLIIATLYKTCKMLQQHQQQDKYKSNFTFVFAHVLLICCELAGVAMMITSAWHIYEDNHSRFQKVICSTRVLEAI